ncbi:MAG: hypothetical protein PHV17_05650 [Candidatus Omnitrophica bacterium]|nr:hypothetical protein [Candidatus Omnitrophota bacterium]
MSKIIILIFRFFIYYFLISFSFRFLRFLFRLNRNFKTPNSQVHPDKENREKPKKKQAKIVDAEFRELD